MKDERRTTKSEYFLYIKQQYKHILRQDKTRRRKKWYQQNNALQKLCAFSVSKGSVCPVPLVASVGYLGGYNNIVIIHIHPPIKNPIALSNNTTTTKGYYHIISAMLVQTMFGQTFLFLYILFCLIILYVRRDRCELTTY